ncbi:unnamed protein product [Alternaria alternata]
MAPNDDVKRATSVLTIAQIKFKQAMKKTDTEDRLPIPVEVSSQLFSNIDAVLKQNTRVNIQKCTEWIVKHVAPSKARIAILGDYLIAVSKSIVVDQSAPEPAKKAARNRMDLLLIVNDVLHTDKFHRRNTIKQGIFSDECESFVVDLIEQAAACITERASQLELKLRAIINYWTVNRLLSTENLKTCREKADEALLIAQGGMPVRKRNYLLPEFHGDRYAPWHDLPASYMLEQMIKYPKRPINPSKIQVQRLDKKPVSFHVRNLLDNFFEKIDLKYLPTGDNPTSETTKYKLSLDPMGQLVKQNKETGETVTVANGYGWSPKFCQDMQKFGVPENIKIAREDAERMEDMDDLPGTSTRITGGSEWDTIVVEVVVTLVVPPGRTTTIARLHVEDSAKKIKGAAGSRLRHPPSPRVESLSREDSLSQDGIQGHTTKMGLNLHRSGMVRTGIARAVRVIISTMLRPCRPRTTVNHIPSPRKRLSTRRRFRRSICPRSMSHRLPRRNSRDLEASFPPPPPPNFNGAWVPPPPPPNINAGWPHPLPPNMNMPPHGPQQSNPHGGQYGNQGGNQYGNQGGNLYGNNSQYGQNRGGYQGGRGYGGGQRGGNRGGWRGTGRGGRY